MDQPGIGQTHCSAAHSFKQPGYRSHPRPSVVRDKDARARSIAGPFASSEVSGEVRLELIEGALDPICQRRPFLFGFILQVVPMVIGSVRNF